MISKSSLQAIKALVILAKLPQNRFEGAVSIAKKIHAPQNYLGKLLQHLAVARYVTSQKGMGGGFALAKAPAEIVLFEVAKTLGENVGRVLECVWGFRECDEAHRCPMHDRWKSLREAYLHFLKKTTIADLLNEHSLNFQETVQRGGPNEVN